MLFVCVVKTENRSEFLFEGDVIILLFVKEKAARRKLMQPGPIHSLGLRVTVNIIIVVVVVTITIIIIIIIVIIDFSIVGTCNTMLCVFQQKG